MSEQSQKNYGNQRRQNARNPENAAAWNTAHVCNVWSNDSCSDPDKCLF